MNDEVQAALLYDGRTDICDCRVAFATDKNPCIDNLNKLTNSATATTYVTSQTGHLLVK